MCPFYDNLKKFFAWPNPTQVVDWNPKLLNYSFGPTEQFRILLLGWNNDILINLVSYSFSTILRIQSDCLNAYFFFNNDDKF